MNNRIAKKIRQVNRRNWREFYGDLLELPFGNRLRIAWFLVTHSKNKKIAGQNQGGNCAISK